MKIWSFHGRENEPYVETFGCDWWLQNKNKFHICIILIGEKVSIQNLFSESENCISFFRGWFPLQPVNRDGLLNGIPKDIKRNKK